ncbi:hypothetical protein V5F59_04575 [Xanthobacter autotrophicus DSM 431]|uniref:hypothetical protein n=1 Tax=Xanthobacter nonsaccharivorans TaxID=3119912 RepID=UPI00372C200F
MAALIRAALRRFFGCFPVRAKPVRGRGGTGPSPSGGDYRAGGLTAVIAIALTGIIHALLRQV